MNTPKLLPYYARKAGVPLERAEVLWARAVRKATARTGWVGTSEYWENAMESFRQMLDDEHSRQCTPRVTPLLRSQNTIWRLPLIAMEDVITAWSSSWQRHLGRNARKAA